MKETQQEILVRDMRSKSKYQVDDEYLNGYAKLCGIYATGVYNCLCRHADFHTQKCFPSIETMAERLNVSISSIKIGLAKLVEWNIIVKEKSRSPKTGLWKNNSYSLLDKSMWKAKPVVHSQQATVDTTASTQPSPETSHNCDHSRVATTKVYTYNKDTYINDNTYSGDSKESREIDKNIPFYFSYWGDVNHKYKDWYKNTTERAAIKKLLTDKDINQEALKWILEHLKEVSEVEYMPKVSTPFLLEKNFNDVVTKIKQKINKKGRVQSII